MKDPLTTSLALVGSATVGIFLALVLIFIFSPHARLNIESPSINYHYER